MFNQHQKLMNIFIIAISSKQCSIENHEFIDRAKDMKLKEKLHKLIYYSLIIDYLIEFIGLYRF